MAFNIGAMAAVLVLGVGTGGMLSVLADARRRRHDSSLDARDDEMRQ